jgi:hypothetical protein
MLCTFLWLIKNFGSSARKSSDSPHGISDFIARFLLLQPLVKAATKPCGRKVLLNCTLIRDINFYMAARFASVFCLRAMRRSIFRKGNRR